MSAILIHGENEFAASEFYKETLTQFVEDNSQQALHIFDGENATAMEIEEALSAQSLFSSGQEMVAIKRLGMNTELKDKLAELATEIPNETQLVVYEPAVDKRSKLYKLLKTSNQTKEFINLSELKLLRWVNDCVVRGGGQFEPGSAKLLVDRAKGNQLRLRGEIDKLLNFDKTISLETVRLLVDKTPDDNIFALLDHVARGETKKALTKYDELRAAQVEAHYILIMLCWQMANFISVKSGEKRSDKEIASQLGMNPYAVGKTKRSIKTIPKQQLKVMAKKVMEADKRLKTTSLDADQLIRQLIAELQVTF